MRYDRDVGERGEPEYELLDRADVEGSVYFVRDRAWGFAASGGGGHPGICLAFDPANRYATFIKGTGTFGAVHRAMFVLTPCASNGLYRPTAFELVPRRLPRRLVALMHDSPRLVGRIDPEDLGWLRYEMGRLFGRGTGQWRR
jgi:hypothetical protein